MRIKKALTSFVTATVVWMLLAAPTVANAQQCKSVYEACMDKCMGPGAGTFTSCNDTCGAYAQA